MNQLPALSFWIYTVATLSFMSISSPSPAQETEIAIDYEKLLVSVDAMSQKLVNLRGAVDQTRFDPDEWLDALDYDSPEVVKVVGEHIAFQPYPGVLRGVTGTLRARAGNSMDQSMLLAYMLKSAGYDARIAQGTLDDAEASRLLSTVGGGAPGATLDYLESSLVAQFGEEAVQTPVDFNWEDTALGKRSSAAADALLNSLSGAGIKLGPRDVTEQLLGLTREYFWVQHREGPADPWQDAHPAFGTLPPPANVTAGKYFADSIPEEYQHKLTITAGLSQRQLDTVSTHQLMTPLTQPVANLDGVAINYRNHPNGLTLETLDDVGKAVSASQFLTPTLNGAMAPGAMVFDLQGRVIDPMAVDSGGGAAGVFASLAASLEKATSTVIDPDNPKAVFALESMWLEFTFNSPDGSEYSFRRYILPPHSEEHSQPQDLLWPLITDYTYLVNAGRQPLDYLADRYLATGIAGNDWYKALIHKFTRPSEGTTMPEDNPPQDFAPLAQYQIMDAGPANFEEAHVYRAQPSLLGIRRGFRDANTAFTGVDVVSNAMAHIWHKDGKLWQQPEAALRRGVWDTTVEAVPGRSMNLEVEQTLNALDVFQRASEQGIAVRVIGPKQDSSLSALKLSAAASRSILDDLTNGYTVVVPDRVPEGVTMTGWWRVNAETGETLGMTADGYGSDVVEYMIEVVDIAFNLVQALASLEACNRQTNDVAKMCCLVEANFNNVAGLAAGGLVGATGGAAGSALFTIVDFAAQEATAAAYGQENAVGIMPKVVLGCNEMQATDW